MIKLIAGVLLVLASTTAVAAPADIKGIYIGMTKEEFYMKFPDGLPNDWTIGGVHTKYEYGPGATVDFVDGVLDHFSFFYDADDYETVRDAIASKHPKKTCRRSVVQNRMGAKYNKEECAWNNGELWVIQYLGDLNTGAVIMESKRLKSETQNKKSKKSNDV